MRRTFARTPQACGICRRRKTKCDGCRPCCGQCRRRSLQCVWSEIGVPPGPALSPAETPGAIPPPRTLAPPSASPSPSATAHAKANLDPQALHLCLNLFFERHFVSDFCSFDYRPSFEHKCRQDLFLSCAVVALCARYVAPETAEPLFGLATPAEVSRHYMQKARSLAKATSDEPSVPRIQANLVLAMAELLSNSGSRHWLFGGTAIRMAEIMRLNKEFHQRHSLREQEIRRRTFWACLLFDRTLAFLLAKHRTIQLENVSIAVPGTDMSLVYQEETRGVLLSTLAAYPRPSELGLDPYLIKTVCLWSDMVDFAGYSRRHQDAFPPTDPRSIFCTRNAALQAWVHALPPGQAWSAENYEDHRHLGLATARSFVAMQFLLRSAACVAHQCYLPHLTFYTKLVDLVDAAGLSYLYRDEAILQTCVSNALMAGEMLEHLLAPERADDRADAGGRAVLQSVWVASSALIVANVFLWLQYSDDEICISLDARTRAKRYFDLVHKLVASWAGHWKAARQWTAALTAMQGLYKAAYVGEVDDTILSKDIRGATASVDGSRNSTNNIDAAMDESEGAANDSDDFRPQPGDGYPSLISMPNLHASVKFATGDTSAKAIDLQSIWMQLSGWPYGFAAEGLDV